MCVTFSLDSRFAKSRSAVSVPIILESLEYRSDTGEVIISLDCVVRNSGTQEVCLWVTHIDNVDGRIATEDWFSLVCEQPDMRAKLIAEIHDGCWDFDSSDGRLRYKNPFETFSNSADGCAFDLTATALSFHHKGSSVGQKTCEMYSDFVNLSQPPYTISSYVSDTVDVVERTSFALRAHPLNASSKMASGDLPFSTFGVGPIPPMNAGEAIFFRITLRIAGDSYKRLVQPVEGSKFYLYSGNRLCDEIADFRLPGMKNRPDYLKYLEFFNMNIRDTKITPDQYQLVICQPEAAMQSRQSISVKPTSSRVIQHTVADERLSERVMWFSARSEDFSMALEYLTKTEQRQLVIK